MQSVLTIADLMATDTDGDGIITADELVDLLAAKGIMVTHEQAHGKLLEFDADGDGNVTYDEMLGYIRDHGPWRRGAGPTRALAAAAPLVA